MRVIDRTGVPEFSPSHRPIFNQMVKAAGFKTQQQFLQHIGFLSCNFHNLFTGRIGGELFHRLRDAVEQAAGIDLADPNLFQSAEAPTDPGPLDDLHAAGLITTDEQESGRLLAELAHSHHYPGRTPLQSLVRSWSEDLQFVWRCLAEADAETDMCRPRLPTASLVSWNVCVSCERIDLSDPYSRDALTSLRIALQHI